MSERKAKSGEKCMGSEAPKIAVRAERGRRRNAKKPLEESYDIPICMLYNVKLAV